MAKALRERVGKQYKGTQRTRKAVHGECTVELAKWTFPIISLCREPYEVKVSRTGLRGAWGDVPSGNALCAYPVGRAVAARCSPRERTTMPASGLGEPSPCRRLCALSASWMPGASGVS